MLDKNLFIGLGLGYLAAKAAKRNPRSESSYDYERYKEDLRCDPMNAENLKWEAKAYIRKAMHEGSQETLVSEADFSVCGDREMLVRFIEELVGRDSDEITLWDALKAVQRQRNPGDRALPSRVYDMRYVPSNATYVFFEINSPDVIVGEAFSGGQALRYLDALNEGRQKPLWSDLQN